jgi:hypothetical protein
MADSSPADRDRRLDEAVAAFLRAEQAGGPLDPAAWLAAHPDLRPDLDRFLADRSAVRSAVAGARTPPPAGFAPGAAFDGLRIVREVGRGGMGRVYEAVQVGLDRPVAVKTVRAVGPADAYRLLFADEVRALGRLKHPGIVPVYGCGERGGWPYLVMGLMAGSLADRLAAGPLPPTEAAEIVAAVARAVGHAHERGFLHRDIKPSNVLLDDGGAPHLADFGLVARLGELDRTGRAGTAGYMAPEQFAGSAVAVGERADVYGLGAVLYAALTAHPPLPAGTTAWAEPPPPRQVHPAADRRLEAVCLKCLAQDPAARYPTAAALADELDRFVRPPSRRAALAAGGAAGVAVVGGWWAWRARRDALEREYQQLLAEIRDRAVAQPPRWSTENRAAVARAARLAAPSADPVELRTELARTFLKPDVWEVGTFAHGPKYEVAAFRPGTRGDEVALGECLRARAADPAAPVRVVLVDRPSGQVTRTIDLPFVADWEQRRGRVDGVRGLAFTPDGRWLFAGTRGGGVYAVDLATPAEPPRRLAQDREAVKHLFPTADGRSLVSVALDGRIRRFRLAAGRWGQDREAAFPTPWPGESWEPNAAVLPATGDVVVFAHRRPGPTDTTTLYRFSPTLDVLDRQDLGTLVRLPATHPLAPFALVDFAGRQCPVQLDRLTAGTPPDQTAALDSQLPKYPEQIRFSPDGRVLVTSCDGDAGVVKFWDPATFNPIGEWECPGGSGQVAFAPDAPLVALPGADQVWQIGWAADPPVRPVGWGATAPDAVGLSADGAVVRTAGPVRIDGWDAGDGRWRGERTDFPPSPFRRGWPRVLPRLGRDGYAVFTPKGLRGQAALMALSDDRPTYRLGEGLPGHWVMQADGRMARWDGFGVWRPNLTTILTCYDGEQYVPVDLSAHPQLRGEVTAAAMAGRRVLFASADRGVAWVDGWAGVVNVGSSEGLVWTAAAIDAGGDVAVCGDGGGRLHLVLWPEPAAAFTSPVHGGAVTGVARIRPGVFVSSGRDGMVAMVRAAGGRLDVLARLPFGPPVLAVTASADGLTLAVLCAGERSARRVRLDTLADRWREAGLGVDFPSLPETVWPAPVGPAAPVGPPPDAGNGLWRVSYHGYGWEVKCDERLDGRLAHDWADKGPLPAMPRDLFSLVWFGSLTPPEAGRYRFRAAADDLVTVWVGGRQVLHARWTPGERWTVGEAELTARPTPIRVEYAEHFDRAFLRVEWSKPGEGGFDWREIDPQCLSPHSL